jgi:hypothetical protein
MQEWIHFTGTVLAGFAAVFLAIFAGVEIWRGQNVRRRADAEAAANAQALARHIRVVREVTRLKYGSILWAHVVETAMPRLEQAEYLALQMVTASGGASKSIATAARKAFAHFYTARKAIEEMTERDQGKRDTAGAALDACELELFYVISPVLGATFPMRGTAPGRSRDSATI